MLHRARAGDTAAFGALYSTHLAAARRLARSLVADPSDADDVVAEVFAAAFAAMKKGLGPVEDFRSYLLTSVRRECQRTWRRGGRQRPGGERVIELASARAAGRDDFDGFAEGDVVQRAFGALPPRMQHVLWLTEIEGLSHDEVAERLGSTTAAIAQLARRARVQFGERYLDAHLPATDDACPTECVAPRRVLAEVVRGTASRRAQRIAAEHLATCPACAAAHDELSVVNGRLRSGHVLALLPAVAIARPARLGLLARLAAWIAGPVPAMSVAATIAVATAVAPFTHEPAATLHEQVATAAAPPVADAQDEQHLGPAPSPTTAMSAAPARATPDVIDRDEPVVTAAPAWTAADVLDAAAAGAAATPTVPAVPGTPTADAGTGAPALPLPGGGAITPPTVGPLPDVTGAVEDVVNGVTIDDPVVDAVQPVVNALPDVNAKMAIPSTPPIGPVGPTPPVSLEAGVDGGEVDVNLDVGDAHVGVDVNGDDGLQVQLPPVPQVLNQLPAPVPGLVDGLPLVGNLLGD